MNLLNIVLNDKINKIKRFHSIAVRIAQQHFSKQKEEKIELTECETHYEYKIGDEIFKIQKDKIKQYLDNQIKKWQVLIQMGSGPFNTNALNQIATNITQLTFEAVSYYYKGEK